MDGYIGSQTFGCQTRDETGDIIDFAEAGDRAAAEKALLRGVSNGRCRAFSAGMPVFIEDIAIWKGMQQVRLHGDPIKYWLQIERVKSGPVPEALTREPSPTKKYGTGRDAFEAWARAEYQADKFRYVAPDEVWIALQDDARIVSGTAYSVAAALAQHADEFMEGQGIRKVLLFQKNQRLATFQK